MYTIKWPCSAGSRQDCQFKNREVAQEQGLRKTQPVLCTSTWSARVEVWDISTARGSAYRRAIYAVNLKCRCVLFGHRHDLRVQAECEWPGLLALSQMNWPQGIMQLWVPG